MKRLAVAALTLAAVACSESGDEQPMGPNGASTRSQLIAAVVDNAVVPSLETLVQETTALQMAIAAWAAAPSDAAALNAARTAFSRASIALQRVELMQLGPAGAANSVIGGAGLRAELYSWPIVSACRVDQELVKAEYGQSTFFSSRLTNVYGVDALEYLLFREGMGNACPASQTINAMGTWRMLVDAGNLDSNRSAYASAVASQLAADAARLRDAWNSAFAADLKSAGESRSSFPSTQAALDDLFAAIFYLERELKDTKLGGPLGISSACMNNSCPDILESRHAQLSLEWIRANLEGFELVFLGGATAEAGYGFDDLLAAEGFEDLATTMRGQLIAARAAADAAAAPMATQLETAETVEIYTRVNELARNLKTQFVSALSLRVPNEGAADND